MMINIAVVLLRGCWLDGTNKCLKNGAAEVENIFCFPLLLKNGLLWWQHHFFFLRSVPALPISATPPGLYLILTFTFMHSSSLSDQFQARHHLPCPSPFPPPAWACRSLRPPSRVSTWAPNLPAACWWTAHGRTAWAPRTCTRRSWEHSDTKPDPGWLVTVRVEQGWTQRQTPILEEKWKQKQILANIYNGEHLWLPNAMPTHMIVSPPTQDAKVWMGADLHANAQLAYLQLAYCGLARITNSLLTANLPASRMMIASSDLCWHRSHHGLHKICRCVHFWQFCTNLQQVRKNLLQTCTNCATSVDLL